MRCSAGVPPAAVGASRPHRQSTLSQPRRRRLLPCWSCYLRTTDLQVLITAASEIW